jgi:hypothetical protein
MRQLLNEDGESSANETHLWPSLNNFTKSVKFFAEENSAHYLIVLFTALIFFVFVIIGVYIVAWPIMGFFLEVG